MVVIVDALSTGLEAVIATVVMENVVNLPLPLVGVALSGTSSTEKRLLIASQRTRSLSQALHIEIGMRREVKVQMKIEGLGVVSDEGHPLQMLQIRVLEHRAYQP